MRTDFELKNNKYVSLFDLYFETQSPLPLRFPAYFDFRAPAASSKRSGLFEGFIKQNSRLLQPVYLKTGARNVFIRDSFQYTKQQSQMYDDVYNQIYYRTELAKHFDSIFQGKVYRNQDKEFEYIQSRQYDGNDWHV